MINLKKIDWMHFFFFLLPIIDFLSFLNPIPFFVGLGMKGIFVFYAVFYLLRNSKHKKIFAFLGIYFFILACYLFTNSVNPWLDLMNSFLIFSFPILILFFTYYNNKRITKKSMMIVLLLSFSFYLVGSLFKLKMGSTLFPLFILLFSVALQYVLESNSYLLKSIFIVLFLLVSLFIKAKTFYLSILVILIYFILSNVKNIVQFLKMEQLKALLTTLALCLFIAVYMPQNFTKNVQIHSIKEVLTYNNVNTLLSGRFENLNKVHNIYKNSESLEKVFGLGNEKLKIAGKVESDVFDLFYSFGILGLLFYLLFFLYVLNNSHLKRNYKFSFCFLLIFSLLGNVLSNSYVIPFLALLFLVSKNDQGVMKKNILLVSNMYPSKEYPHYGIFVKNTYDLLKNDYSVDLVVMYKTYGKLNKLVSYIRMCGVSLLKAIFNNYDFIYVHFVSHTTIGVFIPAICSKTKLVLNVHGNDLVADTNVDKKYLLLTNIFLKGADIVVSPSKYFKEVLVKEYHIPKEKVVVYPAGGVDLEKFKKINKKTALKNLNLDSKFKYFGYISRIEKDKGYDTYIKAIHELNKKKKCKDVRFILVGSGSEENKLEKLIQKYKVEKLIVRMPLVSQEELVNIYSGVDTFVYPTRMKSESLGLIGLEAMACEALVIGSNKFGPNDYLIDNENSLTFNPNDIKELTEKMIMSLEMKTREKNKLTKNARKKSEEYSSMATKEILLDIFKR